jgi:hypothetical protein
MPNFFAFLPFLAAPSASDYIVIGDAHYSITNPVNFAPVSPYNYLQNLAGFSTIYATGETAPIQTYGQFTGEPTATYASFGYDLRNVSASSPINTVGGNGSLAVGNVTVTLTTTVANCYGIVFLYSNNFLPAPIVATPAGLTQDFTASDGSSSALIAYHSTTLLPLGTTTYTFVETSPISLLVQAVAFAP